MKNVIEKIKMQAIKWGKNIHITYMRQRICFMSYTRNPFPSIRNKQNKQQKVQMEKRFKQIHKGK